MIHLLRCTAFVLLVGAHANAQIHANRLSVPIDPAVREQLARALAALASDDLDRALITWQGILDGTGGRVLQTHYGQRSEFVSEQLVVASDRFTGVRSYVLMLILGLPEESVARYRELMEPRARRFLDQAVANSDEADLRACIRRYSLTASGNAAALALVDLLIEEGRFPEARLVVQRVRGLGTDPKQDTKRAAQLLAREALALWGNRKPQALEELERTVPAELGKHKVTVGGRDVAIPKFIDGLTSQLLRGSSPATQPPLHRKVEPDWTRSFRTDDYSDSTMVYPVMPQIRDDLVFYSDGRFLRGRRLVSGTDYWRPVESPLDEYDAVGDPDVDHHVVIDRDLVIGYLESEPMMENPWHSRRRAVAGFKLVAAERRTGKIRWTHFGFEGKNEAETAFISRLSVCQPPLVVGDTLYVAGTILKGIFHHWICALDRETGHILWRTYVGAGQTEVSRGGNPTRASIPGQVGEHRGALYYSTNMGVICSVDALTGTIRWQSAYHQDRTRNDRWSGRGWGRWGRRSRSRDRTEGWRSARPVVEAGKLFITPSDTSSLYVGELDSGKLTPISEATLSLASDAPCLVGVHDGKVVLSGKRMTALDARTLRPAWRFPSRHEPGGARIIRGIPRFLDGRLALTTADATAQLEVVDPSTGLVIESRPLRDTSKLGNVYIDGGSVAIGHDGAVSTFTRE